MKPEFHEDYLSSNVDPTAEPYIDFDWDELEAALGECKDEDLETKAKLALAFRRVFRWVFSTDLSDKRAPEFVARRAIALAWVTNPEIFNGKSMSQLAKQLGIKKQVLSRYSAAASRKFGICNRGQAHGWNRGVKRPGHSPEPPTGQSEAKSTLDSVRLVPGSIK